MNTQMDRSAKDLCGEDERPIQDQGREYDKYSTREYLNDRSYDEGIY